MRDGMEVGRAFKQVGTIQLNRPPLMILARAARAIR